MDYSKRKLLSTLCHGAIFLSATLVSVGIPIAVMFLTDDSVVKANAKESLNFHISLYILGLVFGFLAFFLVGIPLLIVLWAASLVFPIMAIVSVLTDSDKPYRYPFIFRIV
ncbi:MAG: DUF4870 domain-containing protein [Microcoleaceae cyanobacterium]